MNDEDLAKLVRAGRPAPASPARIGRHAALVESGYGGTSVYLVRGGRVLTVRANKGYRKDVVAALFDAVEDLMRRDDLGARVWVRPIEVAGFGLDRAALLGPGESDFFRGRAGLDERGLQVVPVHRSEVVDGEDAEVFRWAVHRGIGIDQRDWTREPRARADVLRIDGGQGGLYRRKGQSRNLKRAVGAARDVLGRAMPALLDGVRLSVLATSGHELEVERAWDRVRGTLRAPDGTERDVDVPRHAVWDVFGPLFGGGDTDFRAGRPGEAMLMMRVNDEQRRRYDEEFRPTGLEECLTWLRAIQPVDGNFLVFHGKSGGVVQMAWEADGRLWIESAHGVGGRHASMAEAERAITVLAEEDRVALRPA